jgi:urease accessory protein
MTLRATQIARAHTWPQNTAIDSLTLDYDSRHRRRFHYTTASGLEIQLHLAETTHIQNGDALILEDGRYIEIKAAPESLLEITTPTTDDLTRLAWHLGNRHLAVQFLPAKLRILHDHVIAQMLKTLGATVTETTAPFDPESGAYHHD